MENMPNVSYNMLPLMPEALLVKLNRDEIDHDYLLVSVQEQGCGVGVGRSRQFKLESESESIQYHTDSDSGPVVGKWPFIM